MKRVYVLIAALAALLLPASLTAAPVSSRADRVEAAIQAQYAYQPPRAAKARSTLSAAERRQLMAWLSDTNGKGLVPVDLTDARELKMMDLLHKAARRPAASRLVSVLGGVQAMRPNLDKCGEFLKQHQANGLFMDVGSISGDKLTAATMQATFLAGKPQDVRNFGTVLVVLDSNGNEVTDGSGLSHKEETTLLTDAPPALGKIDEDKPPQAGALFTTFMTDGTPCTQRHTAAVLPPPKSIVVTAPNNSQNRKTVICLNRANPEPAWPQACDFGPFPQGTVNPTKVVVPLAGTIMMPYPLALEGGKIKAQLQVTAINSQNGTTCSGQDANLGLQVLAQTKPTGDSQGVTWSILGPQALIFGETCYQPHSGLAFNMYWTVAVQKPGAPRPSTVTAIVSNVLERGSANTLIVRNVDLQWGCLPVGTLVTMADHTQKPIEDITPHELVLGPDGRPWEAFGKLSGDEAELIVVTAEDGTAARMTGEHPVIIGSDDQGRPRWTAAWHLTVGTSLVTAKGASKVAAVERQPYGGKVYNIALRPQGAEHAPKRGASFYADGLLVGDQTMQGLPEPGLAQSGPSATAAN
ncbi:Hint domain-containing protein [Bradyrhizobium prioriisuperbiae]|uniref:Hint domain-containing protein n=1 Tax=Bradyrhizobium prioriisuperbiae TaxID=2854389 RepID=UPI0028E5BA06|nr:Hint domain-containing protein [Bradyrhizobium prioritasuperba]